MVWRRRSLVLGPRGDLPIPLTWLVVAIEYWPCTEQDTRQAWYAMAESTFSEVVAFRQRWLLMPAIGGAYDALRAYDMSPQHVLKMFELCCLEGVLERPVVGRLEEAILRVVDRDGHWKP